MFKEFQLKHGVLLIAAIAGMFQIIGMASSNWLAVEKSAPEHAISPQNSQHKSSSDAFGTANLKNGGASSKGDDGMTGMNRNRRSVTSENTSLPSSNSEHKPAMTGNNQQPTVSNGAPKSTNTEYRPMSDTPSPPARPGVGKGPRPGKGTNPQQGGEDKQSGDSSDDVPSRNNMTRPFSNRNTPKPSNNDKGQPSDDRRPVPASNGNGRPSGNDRPSVSTNNGNARPNDDGSRPVPRNDTNGKPNSNGRPSAPTNNGNYRPSGSTNQPVPTNNGKDRPNNDGRRPLPANNTNDGPTGRPTVPSNNGNNRPSRPIPPNNGKDGSTSTLSRPTPANLGPNGNGRPIAPSNNEKGRPNSNQILRPQNNSNAGPSGVLVIPENTGKTKNVTASFRQTLGGAAKRNSAEATYSNTNTVLTVGLWEARLCLSDTDTNGKCETADVEKGLDSLLLFSSSLAAYGLTVSTWHSLRVETVIAVVFCLAGLLVMVLGSRPMFARLGRKRAVVITSVFCMAMSCILYLVAVSRVAALNQSLMAEFRDLGGEFVVYAPWSVVVGGIGACLAFVAASLQAFCAWYEERRMWSKFQNEVSLSTAEERNVSASAPSVGQLDITFDTVSKNVQRETET